MAESIRQSSFRAWERDYDGLLYADQGGNARSRVYGWDTRGRTDILEASIRAQGAVWGFIVAGTASVSSEGRRPQKASQGEFFVTTNGAFITLDPATQLFAVQQLGFRAIPLLGGPIEVRGRLRYIDGCSDTLLIGPPVAGDPCLNHLHFPAHVVQTQHTHESLRAGVIARGEGSCITPNGTIALVPGLIFVISVGGVHGFQTNAGAMDVLAYHPDSDFGPRHENHPTINRTLVGGDKVDNSVGVHSQADVVQGRFAVAEDDLSPLYLQRDLRKTTAVR